MTSAEQTTVNGRHAPPLTHTNINPLVRRAEYAVRGELAVTAEHIRAELADPDKKGKWPFEKVVNCNIGNPQQLGQKPLTFLRQVSALVECPDLIDNPIAAQLFPSDARTRARTLLTSLGAIGAYSHSQGVPSIRRTVANFISQRDGYPSDPDHIFLTDGASTGVKMVMEMLVDKPGTGFLIPVPQYPLYSATATLVNAEMVPYYMDESHDWGLKIEHLMSQLTSARSRGINVRALCIINPGNPTGAVLTLQNMQHVLKLCAQQNLILIADEVYQTNIYYPTERPWSSFKKVMMDMGGEEAQVQLFSLHSISKGMVGECGRRGGWFEATNVEEEVLKEFYKLASVSLCPNVLGQIAVDIMVNPPKKGDESYETYTKEYKDIYESLKRRSKMLCDAFNSMEGVTCNRAQGAMYLFASMTYPTRFLTHATTLTRSPDLLYALDLLKATGVCMVPGCGFGQEKGTFHVRSTFLPQEDVFKDFVERIKEFHKGFWERWR